MDEEVEKVEKVDFAVEDRGWSEEGGLAGIWRGHVAG